MSDFDSFDALTESPEQRALAVELGDLTLPWLADGLAIERAKDKGHELGDILSELEVLDALLDSDEDESIAELANRFGDVYPAVARLLWLGFLRFEPTINFDSVLGMVGPGTLKEVPVAEMMSSLFPEKDEEAPESEGK